MWDQQQLRPSLALALLLFWRVCFTRCCCNQRLHCLWSSVCAIANLTMAFLLRLSASPTAPADPQRRPKIFRKPLRSSLLQGRQQNHHNKSIRRLFSLVLLKRKPMALPASPENVDLMQFLQQDCPEDVLPKILAFCGPQKMAALSQTCTAWRDIILDDSTWRILCEDLYKVRLRDMLVIVALFDEDSLVIGKLVQVLACPASQVSQ